MTTHVDPVVGSAVVKPTRWVEQVMGMPISLALRGRHADTERGRHAWRAVIDELHWVDRVFSTYRADSVINRLDRREITMAACPPEVQEVLDLGRLATDQSDGAFSVQLPVDSDGPDGPRRLDPSGVVKGWAAERAARHLVELDDTDFCLSAGGDVTGRADPGRPAWQIGIEDPHDPARVIAVVPLRLGGVATSGATHRGAHVVDGRTGRVADAVASVTVIGPSLTWADIDATAAYALGIEAATWLSRRPIHSALIVHHDASTEVVSGITGRHTTTRRTGRARTRP